MEGTGETAAYHSRKKEAWTGLSSGPQVDPILLTFGLGAPSLQLSESINVCRSSHPVCGSLLQQQTNTPTTHLLG